MSDASLVVFIIFGTLSFYGPEILQNEIVKGNEWTTYANIVAYGILFMGVNSYR